MSSSVPMSEAEEKSKEVEEVLDVAQEDTSGSVALKNSTDAAEAPSKGLNLSEVELSEDEKIKLKKYFDEALIEQQEDLEDGKVAETEGINDAAEDENRDKEKEAEKGSTASDSCSEVPEGLDKQHFVDLVKMILIEIGMKNKPTQADLGKAFVDFDSDKGGTVDFEEFLELFTRVKQGKVNGLGAGPIEQLWQAIVKPKKKDPKMHHVVTITIHFPEESKNSFVRTDDGERPQRLVDALQEGLGYYYRDRIHCIDLVSVEASSDSANQSGDSSTEAENEPKHEVVEANTSNNGKEYEENDSEDEGMEETKEDPDSRLGLIVTLQISGPGLGEQGLDEESANELAERIEEIKTGILDKCVHLDRPNHKYAYTVTEIVPEFVPLEHYPRLPDLIPPPFVPQGPSLWTTLLSKCCGLDVAQSIRQPPLIPLPLKSLSCENIVGRMNGEGLGALTEILHENKIDGKKLWSAVWQEVYREREMLKKKLMPKKKFLEKKWL